MTDDNESTGSGRAPVPTSAGDGDDTERAADGRGEIAGASGDARAATGDDAERSSGAASTTEGSADESVGDSADESADDPADVLGGEIEVPELGTVLVTGGAGFIGSHLVETLADETDVRVLDTFDTGNRSALPEDVVAIEGDVRDRALLSEAVTDVDVIVHLAAQVSVEDSLSDPRGSSETNVAATLDVLELARRENARVVVASSAAIYGDPPSIPVHETDPKRPESPYGVDKLAVDNYARVYAECFDVPAVVLRYFNVYGPGANAGVVQAFAERAVAGDPLLIHGDGEQTRDFVHVRDVVRATLAATVTEHTGRAFNVGTGERVSIAELAALIDEQSAGSTEIEHAPPRSGDVEHSRAAIDRARTTLGFQPRIALEDGIASVLAAERRDAA